MTTRCQKLWVSWRRADLEWLISWKRGWAALSGRTSLPIAFRCVRPKRRNVHLPTTRYTAPSPSTPGPASRVFLGRRAGCVCSSRQTVLQHTQCPCGFFILATGGLVSFTARSGLGKARAATSLPILFLGCVVLSVLRVNLCA